MEAIGNNLHSPSPSFSGIMIGVTLRSCPSRLVHFCALQGVVNNNSFERLLYTPVHSNHRPEAKIGWALLSFSGIASFFLLISLLFHQASKDHCKITRRRKNAPRTRTRVDKTSMHVFSFTRMHLSQTITIHHQF